MLSDRKDVASSDQKDLRIFDLESCGRTPNGRNFLSEREIKLQFSLVSAQMDEIPKSQ
jgi:hypothetical protein